MQLITDLQTLTSKLCMAGYRLYKLRIICYIHSPDDLPRDQILCQRSNSSECWRDKSSERRTWTSKVFGTIIIIKPHLYFKRASLLKQYSLSEAIWYTLSILDCKFQLLLYIYIYINIFPMKCCALRTFWVKSIFVDTPAVSNIHNKIFKLTEDR